MMRFYQISQCDITLGIPVNKTHNKQHMFITLLLNLILLQQNVLMMLEYLVVLYVMNWWRLPLLEAISHSQNEAD